MFNASSSSVPKNPTQLHIVNNVEHRKMKYRGKSEMSAKDREEYLKTTNRATVDKYMNAILIKEIKESFMKINILEKEKLFMALVMLTKSLKICMMSG